MKKLTIFTPTFNRIHTLVRTYNSLCEQDNKEFIWLIIDDGSSDNTKSVVSDWINENKIEIVYKYKENGGMHTAHNLAYSLITTELNMCIDSDDIASENCVDKILKFWEKNGSDEYAGIVGLDADFSNNVIGTKIPDNIKSSTLSELYIKHHVKGDKKLVYRTDVINSVDCYPEFPEERLVPLSYKYLLVDKKKKLLLLNEILCNVDYQSNGSTNTIKYQYFRSPKGFLEFRVLSMKYSPSFILRVKACMHYIFCCIILKKKRIIRDSPKKILTFLCFPFGIALYFRLKKYNVKG